MTYGKEDIDYRIDNDPSSGYIFNGAESVLFRRIRNLMHNDLVAMYQNRDEAGAWSDISLINEFDMWQNQFPEVLWKLDFERKYDRTYRGISFDNSIVGPPNTRFLKFMMNGRKKYHRRQFERDQNMYMGTKYITLSMRTKQIMVRCNTPDNVAILPDYTIEIVPYSDMYLNVLYGNSSVTKRIRAKAGVTYRIECPLTAMDNTAIIIYCAPRIQALNDLSRCYIDDNDFSYATKLQKLVIGSSVQGYSNMFLSKLTLGDNPLLEELDIRNCRILGESINLSRCNNLKYLYANGSIITGVTFATNGKIEEIHLPNTINTIKMKNLNFITTLNMSYDKLDDVTIENTNINTLELITDSVDTINILRLVGINWTLTNTELLNKMLEISNSYVSGSVNVTGAIRTQELLRYEETWPDLKVTYRPENIVPQYLVTYVNADPSHTFIYDEWVDQNGIPSDPYSTGKIKEKPYLESDEQFDYSFGTEKNGNYVYGSGWDNITDPVYENRTVVAVYSKTIRVYTTSWYTEPDTDPLYSMTCEYGKPAVYNGPALSTIEDAHLFKIFTGWDKSTGFIHGDTNVYANWDSGTLPVPGTNLKDMRPAEIYAVVKSGKTSEYFYDKDYVDVTLGRDYDFKNVQSIIIAENEYFDGTKAITTDHKLFGLFEKSFTLAIDLRFISGNANATILSCFENNNNNGFRIRLVGDAINIQWGDKNTSVSHKGYRDMIVLRHRAGEKQLYVYTSTAHNVDSPTLSKNFNLDSAFGSDNPRRIVLTATNDITTEFPLTLGAVTYADGSHAFYGTGMVYWCKIWFNDLGNNNCEQLATWHHETLRMEYCGANKYQLSNTGLSCSASFIANNLLEDRNITLKLDNAVATNWSAAIARTFLNERVLPALPIAWQTIIKQVSIDSTPYTGSTSPESVYTDDYLYLPSEPELNGGISFMESNIARVKFNRFIVPNDSNHYTTSTDPQTDTDVTVKVGDIWTISSISYILVSPDDINRYGLTVKEGTSMTNIGGWVAGSMYWTRTICGDYYSQNYAKTVLQNGSISEMYVNTANVKLCVCFSI